MWLSRVQKGCLAGFGPKQRFWRANTPTVLFSPGGNTCCVDSENINVFLVSSAHFVKSFTSLGFRPNCVPRVALFLPLPIKTFSPCRRRLVFPLICRDTRSARVPPNAECLCAFVLKIWFVSRRQVVSLRSVTVMLKQQVVSLHSVTLFLLLLLLLLLLPLVQPLLGGIVLVQ